MDEHFSKQAAAALRRVAMFGGCSDEELALIGSLLVRVEVAAGTVVIHEGGADRRFFVIASGYARVSRDGTDLGVIGPGSFVGEMALLNDGPPAAAVTAATPLTMWALDSEQFPTRLDHVRGVAERVRQTTIDGVPTADSGG
jgi:CRP/FNR family cyclic AMP-dependent transcriptional regulator